MSSVERESLFSLEVVVDELSIPGITCRYPAVAVRLMDFPTLLINHADARLIRKIQLNLQQKAEVPRQFTELLDDKENFNFQKGKSCLFKFSAKNLRMHLSQTPLYILVVDTFPEIPKLIASCVVPLCTSIEKLYDHICNVGLAIPETDGQRGQYTLRNLMGVEVGQITFGYRLISLGEGLLQHIPKEALVVPQTEEERQRPFLSEEVRDPDMIPVRDVPKPEPPAAKPEPEPAPKRSQLGRSKPEILEISKVQHIFKESVMNLEFQNEGTQTDPPRKAVGVGTQEAEEELVYRPPPLFYNSNAEEKIPKPVVQSYVGFDYEEDKDVEEVEQFEEPPAVVYRSPKPAPIPRTGMQYSDLQQNLAQFPVLRALFDELNKIQGVAFQMSPDSAFQQVPTRVQQKPKVAPKSAPKQPPKFQGKENRDDFLVRMAQPKTRQERSAPVRHSPQEPVPKNKSWIRKEPAAPQKRTRLQYGMTNTQRLRLAMNNPQMLHDLEGDKPKSPIAQKLLENLATLGKTRVLSDQPPVERPVPTPRQYPPVRHSNEFEDKGDYEEESEESETPQASDEPDEESSRFSPPPRPSPNANPTMSIHIPVANNESEILDSQPKNFPGIQRDDSDESKHEKVTRDQAMKIPVINPKASKNSPISSLRNSQAFTARSELEQQQSAHPLAKPRRSIESLRAGKPLKLMKSVSFDAEDTNTKVSSEYEPSFVKPPRVRPIVSMESVNTDSVSSYAPTNDEDDYDDDAENEYSEYSDDFEVDIPTSPTHRPSLPNVEHMGYTY